MLKRLILFVDCIRSDENKINPTAYAYIQYIIRSLDPDKGE